MGALSVGRLCLLTVYEWFQRSLTSTFNPTVKVGECV